jgi:hypothetical protein
MWPSRQISSIMKCIQTLDAIIADLSVDDEKYNDYKEQVNKLNHDIFCIKLQATSRLGCSLTKSTVS